MISKEEVLQKTKKLPVMPVVAVKLANLVASTNSNISEIVRVISYDQSLTANLMRWANSSIWGQRRKILDVKEAVIRLGPGRILEIIVGSKVKSHMENECPQYGLYKGEMWKHAIASALAAEELQNFAETTIPSDCFTAALLHDIGKLAISEAIDEKTFSYIVKLSDLEKMSFLDSEKEILKFSHQEIGGEIAKKWNFPESIRNAIQYHHNPDEISEPTTDVAHISNLVAKTLGIGLGYEALNLVGSTNAAKRIKLSREGFEKLCAKVITRLPEIEQLYQ